ncbi:MAG: hypothetical protein QNJ54_15080 [Prochloraceae cyanobacterium]|nr:hypothetical protein [Prochloraceae cyanobacterium]
MITIDVTLKFSPLPLSVERKEAEDAEALYKKITEAMLSQSPSLIELTCEKQPDKKIAVLSDQISAVIISKKTGAAASGKVPGFFANLQGESTAHR